MQFILAVIPAQSQMTFSRTSTTPRPNKTKTITTPAFADLAI
jgi:hypothetical protein